MAVFFYYWFIINVSDCTAQMLARTPSRFAEWTVGTWARAENHLGVQATLMFQYRDISRLDCALLITRAEGSES